MADKNVHSYNYMRRPDKVNYLYLDIWSFPVLVWLTVSRDSEQFRHMMLIKFTAKLLKPSFALESAVTLRPLYDSVYFMIKRSFSRMKIADMLKQESPDPQSKKHERKPWTKCSLRQPKDKYFLYEMFWQVDHSFIEEPWLLWMLFLLFESLIREIQTMSWQQSC